MERSSTERGTRFFHTVRINSSRTARCVSPAHEVAHSGRQRQEADVRGHGGASVASEGYPSTVTA
eukprot:4787709-Prymnesium_polylepis.1